MDQEHQMASGWFCVLRSKMPKTCPFLTSLVIFGISVQDVLKDSPTDVARNRDVLDLFCGAAAIHRAAVDLGLASTAFELAIPSRAMSMMSQNEDRHRLGMLRSGRNRRHIVARTSMLSSSGKCCRHWGRSDGMPAG